MKKDVAETRIAAVKRKMQSDLLLKHFRLLNPSANSVLVIPKDANVDSVSLSVALMGTPIKYAIIAPNPKDLRIMPKEEIERFVRMWCVDNGYDLVVK